MKTFINYRFDLVNRGYEILFDGRKISYEEFKEIKKSYDKANRGLIVRLDKKRKTYFVWDFATYPIRYKEYMTGLLTPEEKLRNDWHSPSEKEADEIIWTRGSGAYHKLTEYRVFGSVGTLIMTVIFFLREPIEALYVLVTCVGLWAGAELFGYWIEFFQRRAYVKKGIVCKACYFYSRTNWGIRLNPTVLATDLNGNMIEGRVRPFPGEGEEMHPQCYMIAYKRIDGQEVYFSPVQSIGIEENECRV